MTFFCKFQTEFELSTLLLVSHFKHLAPAALAEYAKSINTSFNSASACVVVYFVPFYDSI